MENIKHRRHANVDEVVAKAQQGDVFFVRRAVLNGDLSNLTDIQQRKIIAAAYDTAAAYASDQIIPQTSDTTEQNNSYVESHLKMAIKLFFNVNGKSIKEEILNPD